MSFDPPHTVASGCKVHKPEGEASLVLIKLSFR
jgi:hypothetical protein